MPAAIFAALMPTMPPPRITTLAGATPGHAAEQHAAAAVQLLEVLGAFLHRHAAGDFRHRRQQRQLARRQLDRLVRDAGRAAVDVRARQLLVGREVEVREDQLAAAACAATRARSAPSPS